MNRFSVIYIYHKQYCQLPFATRVEAEAALRKFSRKYKGTPVGIYDAKTELFFWEQSRRKKYVQMSLQKQATEENAMVMMAQHLRRQAALSEDDESLELDILLRPMPKLSHY